MEATLSESAITALHNGNKIEAIKIVRTETGLGLKEAKDLVDAYVVAHPELQEKMKQGAGSGFGVILLIIAAAVAYWLFK